MATFFDFQGGNNNMGGSNQGMTPEEFKRMQMMQQQQAQTFPLQQQPQAQQMPMGQGMGQGQGMMKPPMGQGQGMMKPSPMQAPQQPIPQGQPFGGSQLPGTGVPSPNPAAPFDSTQQMTPLEARQLAEAEAMKKAAAQKQNQALTDRHSAIGAQGGLGAQAPGRGDLGAIMAMTRRGNGNQPQYQNFMPQRGLL